MLYVQSMYPGGIQLTRPVLCVVPVLNPGSSDGPEDGLSPGDSKAAVLAQTGADVQALHPQGDHPEVHGCQHR